MVMQNYLSCGRDALHATANDRSAHLQRFESRFLRVSVVGGLCKHHNNHKHIYTHIRAKHANAEINK